MDDQFAASQALASLLAMESFLLAVVGLAANLMGRQEQAGLLSPRPVVVGATVLAWVAGAGSFLAWLLIFGNGQFERSLEASISGVMLTLIILLPVLATAIAAVVWRRGGGA